MNFQNNELLPYQPPKITHEVCWVWHLGFVWLLWVWAWVSLHRIIIPHSVLNFSKLIDNHFYIQILISEFSWEMGRSDDTEPSFPRDSNC